LVENLESVIKYTMILPLKENYLIPEKKIKHDNFLNLNDLDLFLELNILEEIIKRMINHFTS